MKVEHNLFEKIISLENLLIAWQKFKSGKTGRKEVKKFEYHLEDNLFNLHKELRENKYQHGNYNSFYLQDPKLRHIHKASVKDRIVHQAFFQILEPVFEKKFIFDSYASRKNKGLHKGVKKLRSCLLKESRNNNRNCWIVKCDIRKYFENIDHKILLKIIEKKIKDKKCLDLIGKIINSFQSAGGRGLPLGNVTSQLFANVYLNELDKFAKEKLMAKYYLRYNDDFIIIHKNREYLERIVGEIANFLTIKLNLLLHPDKIIFRKYIWGIDFLGYVLYPHFTLPRKRNRKRLIGEIRKKITLYKSQRISFQSLVGAVNSYLGFLKETDAFKLKQMLKYLYLEFY